MLFYDRSSYTVVLKTSSALFGKFVFLCVPDIQMAITLVRTRTVPRNGIETETRRATNTETITVKRRTLSTTVMVFDSRQPVIVWPAKWSD